MIGCLQKLQNTQQHTIGLIVANIKSAIKRVQIAERNRLQNKSYKSAVKTFTKKYLADVAAYTAAPDAALLKAAQDSMSVVYSKIDKAVKIGVYHRNTGARKKAGLARALQPAAK
jgi:small subunit ribosomal protein S20